MKEVDLRDGARNEETPLWSMLTPTRRTKAALSCRNTCFTLVPVVTSTKVAKLGGTEITAKNAFLEIKVL